MAEETIEELLEEEHLEDIEERKKVYLNTHTMINRNYTGEIEKLQEGFVKLNLTTTEEMRADKYGLVHGGFIFSSADFAAMAAVNEPNVVLAAASCQFLSPVKVGDVVHFEAKVRHQEGRKRTVYVTGYIHDHIKVFTADFVTVVTEHHVLKLSLQKEAGIED